MEPVPTLLVVDDDVQVRDWLGTFASSLGFKVEVVRSGEQALESFSTRRPAAVTLDVVLPGIDGLTTLKALRQLDPSVPVIMISGHGETETVVEAVRNGATDFLSKPFEPDALEHALDKALTRRQRAGERRERRPSRSADDLWVGAGPRMRAVDELVSQVADTDVTVLVRGESGTGKEVVARSLHRRSIRCDRPFVKVNCAALPSELLESELFGFEKGAFTGAQRRKLGRFEVADRGTIFLDEITEMHPSLQAKLLQVLQDGHFARLGSEGEIHVDTRVIAASNRDLEVAVAAGSFREDLFYRLNVVTIELPPLRERREELAPLCEAFLARYAAEYGKPHLRPSRELMRAVNAYPWPGNVRELENLIKRLVVLQSEEQVLADLCERARRAAAPEAGSGRDGDIPELERFLSGEIHTIDLKQVARGAARAAERRLIAMVLERTRWNRREAAEILKISYKALLYKMKEAGLGDPAP